MSTLLFRIAVCAAFLFFGIAANAKLPCDGIKQKVSAERQKSLQISAAKQLNVYGVNLLAVFTSSEWNVLYVDTHQSDEVFLFYSADPVNTSFLSMWSGAAMRNEAPAIKAWALKNAPGIPRSLAGCFAWYATAGR